jgi:hypothetical protein
MFDIGRIGEFVGSLMGGQQQEQATIGGIAEILERAGVDPSALAGHDQTQILEFLAQQGVDTSLLEGLDLTALGEQLGQGEGMSALADLIGRATER